MVSAILTTFTMLSGSSSAAEGEEGFTSIFNGKDLTGWDGKPGWWYVENGALTSESTKEKPCPKCNYLIWRGGEPGDFELRAEYRLAGVGANSGIQFRNLRIRIFAPAKPTESRNK